MNRIDRLGLRRPGGKVARGGARSIAVYTQDEGGLRRLVQGSRFDRMTPKERFERVERWPTAEAAVQGIGEDANMSRSRLIDAITFSDAVANMTVEAKMAAGERLGRLQAEGRLDALSDGLP